MQFYLIMFFIYLVASGYWIRLMTKFKENRVSLHFYYCCLLLISCLECAITFLEYDFYNSNGKRLLPLTVFSVFFTALRETLSRLLCLLIALGYGIVMNILNRYTTRIGMMSFLYFIACSISRASFYINQHKPLTLSVKVLMLLPSLSLDGVFLLWIVNALLRTLSYLKVKR